MPSPRDLAFVIGEDPALARRRALARAYAIIDQIELPEVEPCPAPAPDASPEPAPILELGDDQRN